MSDGRELLNFGIDTHGGLDRWRSVSTIDARISAAGFAFTSKFKRRGWRSVQMRISTGEPHLEMSPYPKAGQIGIFEPQRVWIEADDGRLIAERNAPRNAFRSFRHNLWWDDLDMLYFGGYAAWNYFNTPFLLARPDFAIEEIEPWTESGQSWRRLAVTYPTDIPAHSRVQTFYFDADGLLRRFDYTAEVFGSWAKSVHQCFDHTEIDGIVVPMRRLVYPRKGNGQPRKRPNLVWIDVERIDFANETGRGRAAG